MNNIVSFGIIGGDKRAIYFGEILAQKGYIVYMTGFEKTELPDCVFSADLQKTVTNSDYLVLPNPSTTDGSTVPAVFSAESIYLQNILSFDSIYKKTIFCGVAERLYKSDPRWKKLTMFDYGKRKEFEILNALPTAEGALAIAITCYKKILCNSQCLIVGFGNIGKILSEKLVLLGVDVTVSARQDKDIAMIECFGYKAIYTNEIKSIANKAEIVFNTVPAVVIDEAFIKEMQPEAVLIELASAPGGIDRLAAKAYGIQVIEALGLPGKIAPKTAADNMVKIIEKIIGELCHG